jgi:hypothetical protein
VQTAVAVAVALASTTLVNVAYLREHDAAAALPPLSLRRPLQSVRLLLGDRRWLRGFVLESAGFALYVVALSLAPLTVVQSIAAGGIGVLALVSHARGRPLRRHELAGALIAMAGLVALGVSLAGGSGEGSGGSVYEIELWLGATAGLAVLVLALGRGIGGFGAAQGIAGGLFFSIGDISVKIATQGGGRAAFGLTVLAGYGLGTVLLQLGYQRGDALTVAGLATLLTNALPIVAGTVVLDEPLPSGTYRAVRIAAFAAVVVGALLLARRDRGASGTVPSHSAAYGSSHGDDGDTMGSGGARRTGDGSAASG